MTESEKIKYAKSFIDKLSNGINPLNNTPIPDGDIAKNTRLSKCFSYVSEILQREIDAENKKEEKAKHSQRAPFSITQEQLQDFEYSQKPISATELAKKINLLIDRRKMKSLSYRQISLWLMNIGMLEYTDIGNGKKKRQPTQQGEEIGIILLFYGNTGKKYPVILYSESAQRFIINNIDAVAATEVKKGKTSFPWGIDECDIEG